MKLQNAKVLENKKIAKDTFILKFKYNVQFIPTQFVLIDTYPKRFLLKPFSIANYEHKSVSIIYRIISDGTKFLSTLKLNDNITFLGPFGNVKKFKNILKNIKTKTVVLIAGGSGVASIIYLYNYLKKFTDKLYLFYGEKTKDYVIKLENFGIKNVVYCTDDGSYGKKGNIVEVFKKHNINCEILFCCGPKPMIKSLQNLIKEKNDIKSYALMEEYMCCGVGVCRSCVVKIKSGDDFVYETVCSDGPLFEIEKLII